MDWRQATFHNYANKSAHMSFGQFWPIDMKLTVSTELAACCSERLSDPQML